MKTNQDSTSGNDDSNSRQRDTSDYSIGGKYGHVIHPANSGEVIPPGIAPRVETVAIRRTIRARTIEDLRRELTDREESLVRTPFPLSQVRVEPDRLMAGARSLRLGAAGIRRLCKWFRAPVEYILSLPPKLRARVLQQHFRSRRLVDSKLTDKTSCIVNRDDQFLDLGRTDLFTLENAAVVQAMCDGIGAEAQTLEVKGLHVKDATISFDVVSPPGLSEEVRRGDIVQAGLHIERSQFHGIATQAMAYFLRLVCENGSVQRQCVGENHRSTPRTRRLPASRPEAREMQISQIRTLVANTWAGLAKRLETMRRLRDKKAEARPILEKFLRQAHLFSHDLMNRLLTAWEQEGSESTAFGVLNALTRVATHAQDLPDWKRQRLARLSGIYANQDVHLCPRCFSILAG